MKTLLLLLASAPLWGATGDITAVRIAGDTQQTSTNCAITSTAAILVCTGGAFVSLDATNGYPIKVVGAGAAGVDLVTTISAYTSATTITLAANASTTVAGATVVWGINHNGWVAEIDITGLAVGGTYATGLSATNNPSAAKAVFTVTSNGYDNTGSTTTLTRTVYCINPMRQAYPTQTAQNEYVISSTLTIKCVLSDYVYSTDTATATIASGFYTKTTANNAASGTSVTINSTVSYPKVVARWAWPGYEVMTASTFLLEAVAFDRFPKPGYPVAAVVFTCADTHSHTATAMATKMVISSRGGDALPVQVYAANISTAALTQGDVATCNFKAYPWVGDSGSVQDSSGGTAGNENLGPLLELVDTAGTYGQAHAFVNSSTGSDSTCTSLVFTTRAAAEASTGFATWGKAFTCAKAFGSRANSNDNIFVWINGTINLPGTNAPGSDQGVMNTWASLAPATAASCTLGTVSNTWVNIRQFKVSGCTLSTSSTGPFRGDNTNAQLWLDLNVSVALTGTAPIYQYKMVYVTRSASVTTTMTHFSTNKSPYFLRSNIGPSAGISADLYTAVGNKQIYGTFLSGCAVPTGQSASDNAVYAYNSVFSYAITGARAVSYSPNCATSQTISTGIAMAGNLIEVTAGASPGAFGIDGDTSFSTASNIIWWQNTGVGERSDNLYNDGLSTTGGCNWSNQYSQLAMVGNSFSNENIKADTFSPAGCTPSGVRNGNWGARLGPGRISNVSITRSTTSACDSSSNYFGALGVSNTFGPEFGGLFSPSDVAIPIYISDLSCGGDSGTGNGNYRLKSSSPLVNLMRVGSPLPYDLDGLIRNQSGYGSAGAYEQARLLTPVFF